MGGLRSHREKPGSYQSVVEAFKDHLLLRKSACSSSVKIYQAISTSFQVNFKNGDSWINHSWVTQRNRLISEGRIVQVVTARWRVPSS